MKTTIFFLLLGSLLNMALGQNSQPIVVDVPLQKNDGYGPFGFEYRIPQTYSGDLNKFRGIPHHLDTCMIWEVHFQTGQYLFQQYQLGKISEEDFRSVFDSDDSFSSEPVKESIFVLVGLENAQKRIIVDGNQNLDFNDDLNLVYDTLLAAKVIPAYQSGEIHDLVAYRDTLQSIINIFMIIRF